MNDEFGGAKHRILRFSYLFEKPFQSLSLPMKSAFPPRRDLQTEQKDWSLWLSILLVRPLRVLVLKGQVIGSYDTD